MDGALWDQVLSGKTAFIMSKTQIICVLFFKLQIHVRITTSTINVPGSEVTYVSVFLYLTHTVNHS